MASRFQKKSAQKIPAIPGTRPSMFNYQLLTGSGIPGLDHLLGGGFPIGTVVLVEDVPHEFAEESGQRFSQLLSQYFLAEGACFGHKMFSTQSNITLPAIVSSDSNKDSSSKASDKEEQKMTIAWRYEGQAPKGAELMDKSSNHHFNLNKTLPKEILLTLLSSWSFEDVKNDDKMYNDLFQSIESHAKPYLIDPNAPGTNLLRISLSEIGSSLFESSKSETDLLIFLYRLRSLARSHLIVIFLSLSPDFFIRHEIDGPIHKKAKELVDFVIDLTAFNKAQRQHGVFKDQHGIIEVDKAMPLNCLQNSANANNIKAKHLFKSLRTKFSITPMHLPPDADVTKTTESLKSLEF